MASKNFNSEFALWVDSFYENMKGSADMRAEMHEMVTDLEAGPEVSDDQAKIIQYQMTSLSSLYHLIDRNQEKFRAFTTLFLAKEPACKDLLK